MIFDECCNIHYQNRMSTHKVTLRVFPSAKEGRRSSFVAQEVQIGPNPHIKVSELWTKVTNISKETHKFALGINFLTDDDVVNANDFLNVISI